MKGKFKFGLLLFALIFCLWGVITYSVSCDREITTLIPNARNNKILVQYNLSCGALAGSTNLVIVSSKYQIYFLSFFEPFYTTEYDYNNLVGANWIDVNEVSMKTPNGFRVYRQDEYSLGVKINYE